MGTINFPISLSFTRVVKILTNAIVVEISLSPELSNCFEKASIDGTFNLLPCFFLFGKKPPRTFLLSIIYFNSGESLPGL